MSREGDWMCAACQHLNFKKRDACQRCSCPKYATPADVAMYGLNKTEVMAGDWYCSAMNCGSHNYASRTSCYRCGSVKSDYYGIGAGCGYDASAVPGWKSGDWICSSAMNCGSHNYASRTSCYRCGALKGDYYGYGYDTSALPGWKSGDWICSRKKVQIIEEYLGKRWMLASYAFVNPYLYVQENSASNA
ncbi:hypothetical protein RND71_037309 [Anisodus tanguticus]|uniref:RanBP2-type domain-containing protein n=1 Tax=Anisodus tanguticus TaxID=243964 RepID=A0AAE1V158_9SOLA|nr:hypothetical protein RND71_037309 [Anisodus tanguticus]